VSGWFVESLQNLKSSGKFNFIFEFSYFSYILTLLQMKSRIQIIDDNVALTTLLAKALAKFGYEPVVENNPLLAVNTVRHYMPDLILLDVMMPERDGGRVLADLRNDLSLRYIPVILLTAIAREAQALASTGGILSVVLSKPVQLQELLSVISAQLNASMSYNQLQDSGPNGFASNSGSHLRLTDLPDFEQESPWIDQPSVLGLPISAPSSNFSAQFSPRDSTATHTENNGSPFSFPKRPDDGTLPA